MKGWILTVRISIKGSSKHASVTCTSRSAALSQLRNMVEGYSRLYGTRFETFTFKIVRIK